MVFDKKMPYLCGFWSFAINYGRNGPSCPYCTGGYVDFEFRTDQDLSGFISQKTWVAVTGILRAGKTKLSNGDTKPFYYIEALNVSKMEHAGINPISN